MRRSLPALCALLAATGCAGLNQLIASNFQKPTLTFESAKVSNLSLEGATVDLVYRVQNPNAIGLDLAHVDYLFQVEGKQVVAGSPANGLHIPAQGSTLVSFPANVRFADLAPVLATFLTKDSAHYRAAGHLGINTPIGVVTLPLEKEGSFSLPKIPNVHFDSPRVRQLSLAGATIDLPVTVTNPGGVPLPISGVDGRLELAGVEVGSISLGELGFLAPHATRQVTLPVKVSFGAAAFGLVQALQGNNAHLAFHGSLHSAQAAVPVNLQQLVNVLH